MKTDEPAKYTRAIKDISENDRPREKAIKYGFEVLSPAELLAILIGSGTPGESVIDLSQRMLSSYGNSLQRLGRCTIGDLKRNFKGIGDAKAVTVLAAIRLAKLYSEENMTVVKVTSPAIAYDLMKHELGTLNHEEFWVVALSRAKGVIARKRVAQGGVSSTVVDPKVIMKFAIDNLASSILLYHNHPSGNTMPSVQDDVITKKIVEMSKCLDIPVDDHIVVTMNGYYSYMENGKI